MIIPNRKLSTSRRPALVNVSHEFYSGESVAEFETRVQLAVCRPDLDGSDIEIEVSHPDRESVTRVEQNLERSPATILVELLDAYYNEEDDRQLKVPDLDRFMEEVGDDAT